MALADLLDSSCVDFVGNRDVLRLSILGLILFFIRKDSPRLKPREVVEGAVCVCVGGG